uniref:Uncharacterized protein n=1 Tax=Panagrolaimus davidi TaxID=227884 RepID=A0A914P4J8_9BILA
MKSSIAVFNIFIATLLGYLVKTRIFASLTIKRINNVVLRMSIATIILDFFPNLAAMIGLFLGSKLLNIFGPYSATLTSTNIAITTIMYWKILQRSVKEKSKTSIQYFKSNIQN